MKTLEIIALSEAIAKRAKRSQLAYGNDVTARRSSELTIAAEDPDHAEVIVELDPKEVAAERVKGVRVRFARPQDVVWSELEGRFGSFADKAELSGRPEVPPTKVATARPDGCLPQTIRLSVDHDGKVTKYVVREHYD